MTQTFHIVGAFDRFNYGDVLFAHISEHIVRHHNPDARIVFYGTRASDLRHEGGVQTRAIRSMFRGQMGSGDVVWIAGGEVLGSRWQLMQEHNLPQGLARVSRFLRRKFGMERMDWLSHKISGVPNRLPWLFDGASFGLSPQPRVVYNSVGGRSVGSLQGLVGEWQKQSLDRATWLSVRDSKSQISTAAFLGKPVRLSPDSAVLMAELPGAHNLEAIEALVAARLGLKPQEHYICFQCGINYLAGREVEIAAQLKRLHDSHGLPIVVFAIGRASGHEDQTSAHRISSQLQDQNWLHVAPNDLTVWEIMGLIAGSSCYIGTSLHGFITAFSFAVPRVGLSLRVGKLIGFRDDWDIASLPTGVDFSAIAEAAGQAMEQDRAAMAQRAIEVRARYLADLDAMWTALALPD